MDVMKSEQNAATAELADHLLRFSRGFYESFRIRQYRLRFWRMLFLLLEKERTSADGKFTDEFTLSEINSILQWKRDTDERDLFRWRRQLVKQFRDHKGSFLDAVKEKKKPAGSASVHRRPGAPSITKRLNFSAHFEAAARIYVATTVTRVEKMPISTEDLAQILTEEKGKAIFRKEMDIIGSDYFPAYSRLMDELTKVAHEPEKLAEGMKEYASYWSIILVAWRQQNQNPTKTLNRKEFETDVRHALRNVDKTEVFNCFSSLVQARILVPDKTSDDGGHRLNENCAPALEAYAIELHAARGRLAHMLKQELGMPS